MSNDPIIICGSGRSGTTWVLDSIAEANGCRTVFEPLQWLGVPDAKPFANRYVRDSDGEPELKKFMDKVLSGKMNNLWTDYRILPDTLLWPESGSLRNKLGRLIKGSYKKLIIHYLKYRRSESHGLIVKFIRANLMLGWLSENYGHKILFVVRHPGAVVASKLRIGGRHWRHGDLLKKYLQDKQLREDYSENLKYVLKRSLSPVEAHTVIWCIENALPIHNEKKYGYCVVFYEDLISNIDTEWKRIINALQLRNIPDKGLLVKPSQQAQVSDEIKTKLLDQKQIGRWMSYFDKKQLFEIGEILNFFDIDFYNAFDPMPNRSECHEANDIKL